MSDVRLFNTDDGGDIEFVAGQPTLTEGLDSAVYLSLFGGNDADSGLAADVRKQWWANFDEPIAAQRYRSETQHLIEALPAITGNLRRVEDAAQRDVAWMVDSGIAKSVRCVAGIPALNRIHLHFEFVIDGQVFPVDFTMPWAPAQ